jgi:hypothetical protein
MRVGTGETGWGYVSWTGFPESEKVSIRAFVYFETFPVNGQATIITVQGPRPDSLVASVSLGPTGRLALTDGDDKNVSASNALNPHTWYRLELIVDRTGVPDGVKAFVYDGNASEPDPARSVVFHGAQFVSAPKITKVTFGKLTTASYRFESWIDDIVVVTDSTEPIGVDGVAAAHYVVTARYLPDSSEIGSWSVNCADSVGAVSLVQSGGEPVPIVRSGTGVWTVDRPAGNGPVRLTLTADAGGETAATEIVLSPRGGAGSNRLTLQTLPAGDIRNWA